MLGFNKKLAMLPDRPAKLYSATLTFNFSADISEAIVLNAVGFRLQGYVHR
jgi:hypothetical protein